MQDYESGPGWIAVLALIIVVALTIGAIVWIGSGGTAQEAPTQPVPNEAPVRAG